MIYRMYVRPVLEFGCVLFSGAPAYMSRPLILLEREALRLCLGLPKFVANSILYLESRVPPLSCRFRLLTVQTFLKIYESPLRHTQIIFISQPALFFGVIWPRLHKPQIIFVQQLLDSLGVHICDVLPITDRAVATDIQFDDIFPNNAKLLPHRILDGILQDHLKYLQTNVVIATDASQCEEKSGVGIFSPILDWTFSLRLPDFIPIFLAEFMAVVLALRKLGPSITSAVIVTDSLSLCSSLTASSDSRVMRTFQSLVPGYLRSVRLIWVPGHKGLIINEIADSLAKASISGPILPCCPLTAYVTAARFRRSIIIQSVSGSAITNSEDYGHLLHPWNRDFCRTRKIEVSITKLRCRIPALNFYLHRSGLVPSPLCSFCGEAETIDHFLLSCRRFSILRKRLLEMPLRSIGLTLSVPVILSFGASIVGFSHRNVCLAIQNYLIETNRFPC
nr:uncharacterized protein LOC129387672 [Dermacentor andersoni]